MRRRQIRGLGEGITLIVIGGAILLLIPSQIDIIPGMEAQMSPSFFPTVLAIALVAVGVGMVVQSFRVREGVREGDGFPLNALFRVSVAVALLIAYTLLFPRLGFVVTSALFMGIFIYLFGARNPFKIVLSMVLIPVCVWLFFEKLFRIPLPHGLLF